MKRGVKNMQAAAYNGVRTVLLGIVKTIPSCGNE